MYVREWMTSPVTTVDGETTMLEALALMNKRRIRRLPVVEDRDLVGIITKSDVYAAMGSPASWKRAMERPRSIVDFMTRNPLTIAPNATLEDAALEMYRRRISGLPVVEKGKVVGIITETDVFRALIEILGLPEQGARVVFEFAGPERLLERLQRKIPNLVVRSLVCFHNRAKKKWQATVRVRGRDGAPAAK